MLKINKFFLSDVRCFKGEKEFNIRPLTFLTGENSTGKSTILGCLQTMGLYASGDLFFEGKRSIDFNLAPFQMGTFENIVRRSRPKKKKFELGFELGTNTASKFKLRIILGEQSDRANPIIEKVHLVFNDGEIIFLSTNTSGNNKTPKIKVEEKASKKIFTVSSNKDARSLFDDPLHYIHYRFNLRSHHLRIREAEEKFSDEAEQFYKFIGSKKLDELRDFIPRYFSFAPIRSEPQRTYDPIEEPETSSGSEIPILLRNLSVGKGKTWENLHEKLKAFGELSGLFTDIKVKNLGGSLSSPFQLELKIRKAQAANLMDVGYGVSQILPILVRVLAMKEHTFLLQQPEVHLHPKAEAALTSLLAELTKQKNHAFVIETHSDYMVDRARIEIMQGKIKPEDVSLIYLEAHGKDVEVYNLCFDEQANFVTDPPMGYRDFFLDETHKLLGWDD